MHYRSQDKLDRDDLDKDRKEKKKEKRNSKHQEIFDKEFKAADIAPQQSEAVILSETISPLRPQRPRSQVLSAVVGDRRFSASQNQASAQQPPPVTPRSKLTFSPSIGMEQNGVGSAEPMDVPPPLPVKSSIGDYGNVTDYQDFIPPATPPPPPQRVSFRLTFG
ncbi:unnamed protein product [Ranitomeya imitator]|uniref:Uncharacterized protein n=1 Tax=Ranitomeya imitator TaxID=111125 RepID=A0ABN9MJB8_9NEOB|nr:unnamed protein product [Ranitomeya imitator]